MHPIGKNEDDELGLRSGDCRLQAHVTDFKHCVSGVMRLIGCCTGCLLQCTRLVALPILLQNVCAHCFGIAATGGHYALMPVDVGFVSVQPGLLLQLLLTHS